jgi:hypothetical protein
MLLEVSERVSSQEDGQVNTSSDIKTTTTTTTTTTESARN